MVSRARRILDEMAIGPQQVFYHGTKANFDSFDPNFTGKGNDQEGPGFYFTTNEQLARGYAWPSGTVLEVRLHITKTVPMSGPISKEVLNQARQLMMNAPGLRDTLTDWGEDYKKAFEDAYRLEVDKDSPKEVFEQIWYDFYKYNSAMWLSEMVKMGYQGLEIEQWPAKGNEPACINAVVFDPKCIHIISRKPMT